MATSDWPDDRLCRLFGIEVPIIQAPMAGSSTPEMARAVTQAGALGSLACATLDDDSLHRQLSSAGDDGSSSPPGPFNANFFAHSIAGADSSRNLEWLRRLVPYYEKAGVERPDRLGAGVVRSFDDASCRVVEQARPAVVSFHFGLPAPDLVDRVKRAGAILMGSATTVVEARWLEERGCDVIIAQGFEAGGHRGMFLTQDVHTQLGTLALVPQVVDAVNLPVVAAGGIADGRGIVAAFALGASAVQLGTAFLASREAKLSRLHLEALRGGETLETAVTNLFSGRPARCVVNQTMREMGEISEDVAPFPLGFPAMAPLRTEAEGRNSANFSAHYCGQSAPLAPPEGTSASDLVRMLAEDARRGFERLAR
jgi:nitronate monooxygenase